FLRLGLVVLDDLADLVLLVGGQLQVVDVLLAQQRAAAELEALRPAALPSVALPSAAPPRGVRLVVGLLLIDLLLVTLLVVGLRRGRDQCQAQKSPQQLAHLVLSCLKNTWG